VSKFNWALWIGVLGTIGGVFNVWVDIRDNLTAWAAVHGFLLPFNMWLVAHGLKLDSASQWKRSAESWEAASKEWEAAARRAARDSNVVPLKSRRA